MNAPGPALSVLVLATPDDTSLSRLAALPPAVRTHVGQAPEDFGAALDTAEVVLH
jgi:hypothetical protein